MDISLFLAHWEEKRKEKRAKISFLQCTVTLSKCWLCSDSHHNG